MQKKKKNTENTFDFEPIKMSDMLTTETFVANQNRGNLQHHCNTNQNRFLFLK